MKILSAVILAICHILLCNAVSDNYVIGGNEARPPGIYGWQGYLEIDGYFRSGAILVIPNAALTAASSVSGVESNPSRVSLTFGMHDKDSRIEGQPETYGVVGIQIYPEYSDELGYPNNLAILELDGAVNPDNIYITPIAVPEAGRTPEDWIGLDCFVSGWGRTSGSSSDTPNFLQEAMIPVITNDECSAAYASAGYPESVIGSGEVCAWDPERTKNTCMGDDGGPFVCLQGEQYELVGITSWRAADCSTEYPSVFTMASFYNEWIMDKLPLPQDKE